MMTWRGVLLSFCAVFLVIHQIRQRVMLSLPPQFPKDNEAVPVFSEYNIKRYSMTGDVALSRASRRRGIVRPLTRVKYLESNLILLRKSLNMTSESSSEEGHRFSIENLCHLYRKKNTSEENANLNWSVLNSQSKVLITGILSSAGFHLAIALVRVCGVQNIVGIDAMLPNTIENRLEMERRVAILCHVVPNINFPLPAFLGIDRASRELPSVYKMIDRSRELNLMVHQPTHIVHLAFTDIFEFQPNSGLFYLRQSLASMEQILLSVASVSSESRPSFVFLSGLSSTSAHSFVGLQEAVCDIKELLSLTYHVFERVSSVGIRVPNMYGPLSRKDSLIASLVETAIVTTNFTQGGGRNIDFTQNETTSTDITSLNDFVFLDDVVHEILAALTFVDQGNYRKVHSVAPTRLSLLQLYSIIESILEHMLTLGNGLNNLAGHSKHRNGLFSTSVKEGILKTTTWHLKKKFPYRNPAISLPEVSSRILLPEEKLDVFGDRILLPCSSECSHITHCSASAFDGAKALLLHATDGCELVFYSHSFDMPDKEPFQVFYPAHLPHLPDLCNIFLVPENSTLVTNLITRFQENEKSSKIDLNGRLLYKGWKIVWLPISSIQNPAEISLLKLAPGGLFAPSVSRAIFVSNTSTRPLPLSEVYMYFHMMQRKASSPFSKSFAFGKENVEVHFPALPNRQAILIAKELTNKSLVNTISKQRAFYDYAMSILNRREFRPPKEPIYLYKRRHWIDSDIVGHDFQDQESRNLRCQWYEENMLWDNDDDQLSFAHVMAKRQLKQQISRREPDVETINLKNDAMSPRANAVNQYIKNRVDWGEWHAVEKKGASSMEKHALNFDDVIYQISIQKPLVKLPIDMNRTELFVRIFSEKTKAMSFRKWHEDSKNIITNHVESNFLKEKARIYFME